MGSRNVHIIILKAVHRRPNNKIMKVMHNTEANRHKPI